MLNDLRLAIRGVRRAPAFSIVTIGTLALGIGATAAVLALVNAVLLEALPFNEPDRLAIVRGEMRRENVQPYPVSYLDVREIARETALFSEVAAVTGLRPFNLTAGAEVEHVNGEMSDASYLRALGVSLSLGRWYSPEEAAPPGARVVVIAHDVWQRRFGAGRDVLGKTLLLNEQPYQVIGVAPPGFKGMTDAAQLWLPIGLAGGMYGLHYTENREFRWLSAVARFTPTLTSEQLTQGLVSLAKRLEATFPKENGKFSFRFQTVSDAYVGGLRRPLYALLAGAVLVLLIACSNVANLMLVRAAARRREMAVRMALGASARHLVQPVLVEMTVMGLIAAAVGVAIAVVAARLIVASGAIPLASFTNVRVDPLVVGATSLLAIACALLFGALPALGATRVAPGAALGEGSRSAVGGRVRQRLQRSLIGLEVAVALVLLIGAGLMTRGFSRFLRTDLGFEPERVLSMRVDLIADRYKDNQQYFTFVRAMLDQARQAPGVTRAAVEGPGFPTGGWFLIHVQPDGAASPSMAARRHHVSPGYFDLLGIKRLAGRDFDASDMSAGPGRNVVISRALAQRAFPNVSAVGRRLLTEGGTPVTLTVVGVVEDVEHGGLGIGNVAQPDLYLSVYQSPARSPAVLTLFVQSSGPTGPLVQTLADRLATVDKNLSFYDAQTMQSRLDVQTATGRFLMVLMTVFGSIGLVLAAVGVYGVISYGVSQRTREIGVRIALGALSRDVVAGVVRDALIPVAIGAAAGLAAVGILYRFVASLLYGMRPMDPPTIVVSLLVIATAAVAASGIPARRAARIDPAVALRQD